MPGLLRGVARTAVIAGTATAVSNRVSRRQAGRWAQQEQPQQGYAQAPQQPAPQQQMQQPVQQAAPPQAPPPSGMDVTIEQLKKLGELHESGVLTDAEFTEQKQRLLA